MQLVRVLNDFGKLPSGHPALAALLEEVKLQAGGERQAQLDQLLAQLNLSARAAQPVGVNAQAKPPEIEKPLISPGPPPITYAQPLAETSTQQPTKPAADSNEPMPALNAAVRTPRWPRMKPFRPNILVMKGGGVKGIAYVGALEALEQYGYHFDHFVGASAGAITAAMLAVGYSPQELKKALAETDFRKFKDGWLPLSVPLLFITKGLYRGEAFRVWLENKLSRCDVVRGAGILQLAGGEYQFRADIPTAIRS